MRQPGKVDVRFRRLPSRLDTVTSAYRNRRTKASNTGNFCVLRINVYDGRRYTARNVEKQDQTFPEELSSAEGGSHTEQANPPKTVIATEVSDKLGNAG